MSAAFTDLDRLCVNAIRTLSIDAVQRANSGHPGMPLGAAPMAYVLFHRHLRFDPAHPDWADRDRFVLSGGHGSALLYSMLHLTGFDVSLDDLKAFRQWGSRTPGHPEFGHTPGVEATTGPLGQGTANAVGMAMAEAWLSARYGEEMVDHRTYAIVTDGDLMEGISYEAASLAGHLKLDKLTYLYDANDVTLDGPLSMHFSEDVARRYESCGWHVQRVEDGDHDLQAIDAALDAAERETERPSLILVHTTIGFGSPKKAGSSAAHGSPLGDEELAATKTALGWPTQEAFFVPDEVRSHFAEAAARGQRERTRWLEREAQYASSHAERHREWQTAWAGELPEDWDAALPQWPKGESVATRSAGGKVLNALASKVPWLIGGDADLGGSTKTHIADDAVFGDGDGRNVHFGVREHAMGSILNGMLYHGGVRPFGATFFVFSDYMRPAVRLAALSHLPATYVWTHDSVGVGEDGPTHQPVEHLAALRAVPNLTVLRPADANETAGAWAWALQHRDGPVALVFSRQDLPVVTEAKAARHGVARGGYVLREAKGADPAAVLLATGSEVELALRAQEALEKSGVHVRVVSMPSWEIFEKQPATWKQEVLPPRLRARVAIEAGVSLGWHRWVGDAGVVIGIDRFGASAPGERVQAELGLEVERVVEAVRARV